jgi:hypothetical protein
MQFPSAHEQPKLDMKKVQDRHHFNIYFMSFPSIIGFPKIHSMSTFCQIISMIKNRVVVVLPHQKTNAHPSQVDRLRLEERINHDQQCYSYISSIIVICKMALELSEKKSITNFTR